VYLSVAECGRGRNARHTEEKLVQKSHCEGRGRTVRVDLYVNDVVCGCHSLRTFLQRQRADENSSDGPSIDEAKSQPAGFLLIDTGRSVLATLDDDKLSVFGGDAFGVHLPFATSADELLLAFHTG